MRDGTCQPGHGLGRVRGQRAGQQRRQERAPAQRGLRAAPPGGRLSASAAGGARPRPPAARGAARGGRRAALRVPPRRSSVPRRGAGRRQPGRAHGQVLVEARARGQRRLARRRRRLLRRAKPRVSCRGKPARPCMSRADVLRHQAAAPMRFAQRRPSTGAAVRVRGGARALPPGRAGRRAAAPPPAPRRPRRPRRATCPRAP
jgi:hypothetical protein